MRPASSYTNKSAVLAVFRVALNCVVAFPYPGLFVMLRLSSKGAGSIISVREKLSTNK